MTKHIPIWLAKMLLIIVATIYWGVPQWIFKNRPGDDKAATMYASQGFRGSQHLDNWERDRLLDDSLKKDISDIKGAKLLTPDIYFNILYRHENRTKRYGLPGTPFSLTFSQLMNERDSLIRENGDWSKNWEATHEKYRDTYEPGWREERTKNRKETEEWWNNLPNTFLEIYWSNIIFALFWFIFTFVSQKRNALDRWEKLPVPSFNPLSILLSSIIWPYFFGRSLFRAWLETQAEIEIRRSKINPFSLLTKDEKVLVKKFSQAVKEEREVIREGIRAQGVKHTIIIAFIALVVVSFVPQTVLGAVEKAVITIEHVDQNHPPGVEHEVISIVEHFSLPEIPVVPIPTGERVSKMYFYFTEKIVQGILFHPEPIPWSYVYFSRNQNLNIKNNLIQNEKSKNNFSGTLYRIRYAC